MEYRNLGRSGLQVSLLSLGSWLTFGNQIDDSTAEKLMVTAYDKGVNFFDNAEVYAHGKSEIVMGKILKKMNWRRSSYIVSSKAFFGDGNKQPNEMGLSRKHLTEACHAALKRLQVDYLDLYFCHRPDQLTPIEETVRTMNTLIQQGKIFYWGTSEWSADELIEAQSVADKYGLIGPVMEQPQYNMFHRTKIEDEFLPLFKQTGLGTTIWSPLASGILSDKYLGKEFPTDTRLNMKKLEWLRERSLTEERIQKVTKIKQIADQLNVSVPQLAIAWCAQNPNVSTVILGASKVTHLQENLKSLDVLPLLTNEINMKIETVLANKPS